MTGRISIDADVLVAHARHVTAIADDVNFALDAVHSVNLGGGAFGALCAWMVPPAQLASTVVASHARESQQVLERTQHQVRGTAEDFDVVEDAHRAVLKSLDGQLG